MTNRETLPADPLAGLIGDHARKQGLIAEYPKSTTPLAGKDRAIAGLSQAESLNIVEKLDRIFPAEQNPLVSKMVADGLPDIIRAVQAVKEESKVQYEGMTAQGVALDINLMRPGDFTRINGATSPVGWLQSYTATGDTDWLGTPANDEVLSDNEAMVFLGLIDPIEVPKVSAIQFFRFDRALGPAQVLTLDIRSTFGSQQMPMYQLPRPVVMVPEDGFNVTVFVEQTGDDRLQPVGLIIARRSDITDLIE